MASMREWLKDSESGKQRVVVVHCKAGKGRSGTVASSYLISQEGWTRDDALERFTARRMRSGFGSGVSIPSQLRWIGYVDWWSKHGKVYAERRIEILEVHVWGLRDGVKVAVEGYIEEGKTIKTFHTFGKNERMVMDISSKDEKSTIAVSDHLSEKPLHLQESNAQSARSQTTSSDTSTSELGGSAVIFRPAQRLILPTSDINIDFERRNRATYGFTMVTSVAHVWFNAFFESQYSCASSHDSTYTSPNTTDPQTNESLPDSGVFEIDWDAMDGIKGSSRKGTRALDRLAVVWRAVETPHEDTLHIITEPTTGEPVPEAKPADWSKAHQESGSSLGKDLGLRTQNPSSANVSRANSMTDVKTSSPPENGDSHSQTGVQGHIPSEESSTSPHDHPDHPSTSTSEPKPTSLDTTFLKGSGDGSPIDLGLEKVKSPSYAPEIVRGVGIGKVAGVEDSVKAASTGNLKTTEHHVPVQTEEAG